MGSSNEILSLAPDVLPSIAAIVCVILALSYFRMQPEASKGAGLVSIGLFFNIINLLTVFFENSPSFLPEHIISGELAFAGISSAFMITGGLRLKGKKVGFLLVIILCALFGGIIWHSVFNAPNMDIIDMYRIFVPGFGYASIALGAFGKKNLNKTSGFTIFGWMCLLTAIYYIAQFSTVAKGLQDAWYLIPFFHIIMVFGVMIMANNIMWQQCELYKTEAEGTQSRLKLIIQSSPFPITISRLKDDQLILVNNKAAELFDIDPKKPQAHRTVDYFADKNNRAELLNKLNTNPVVEDFEVLVKKHNSTESFWLLLSARVIDFDFELALYCAFQDITGRKKKELQLYDEATKDPLTGAFNRRQFQVLTAKEIARSKRNGIPFCIIMIDADHFKNVNDTYGHQTGDDVLKSLSNCCSDTLRESDTVFRFGGEEFVLLLPEITLEQAFNVAERLRIKISELRVTAEDGSSIVSFTVSMGIAEFADGLEPDEMIKMADECLYEAKETGRNKVILAPRRNSAAQVAHAMMGASAGQSSSNAGVGLDEFDDNNIKGNISSFDDELPMDDDLDPDFEDKGPIKLDGAIKGDYKEEETLNLTMPPPAFNQSSEEKEELDKDIDDIEDLEALPSSPSFTTSSLESEDEAEILEYDEPELDDSEIVPPKNDVDEFDLPISDSDINESEDIPLDDSDVIPPQNNIFEEDDDLELDDIDDLDEIDASELAPQNDIFNDNDSIDETSVDIENDIIPEDITTEDDAETTDLEAEIEPELDSEPEPEPENMPELETEQEDITTETVVDEASPPLVKKIIKKIIQPNTTQPAMATPDGKTVVKKVIKIVKKVVAQPNAAPPIATPTNQPVIKKIVKIVKRPAPSPAPIKKPPPQ